jgi:hypothetical protein
MIKYIILNIIMDNNNLLEENNKLKKENIELIKKIDKLTIQQDNMLDIIIEMMSVLFKDKKINI